MESESEGYLRFKKFRDERHVKRMLDTTENDRILSQHPYEKYIPHVMWNYSMRQQGDIYELNFEW